MKKLIVAMTLLVAGLSTGLSANAEPCAAGAGPRAAVEGYLVAMQDHRFEDAYDYVTAKMTDGKSRGEWAALQKLFYEGGEVNIFGIDIRPPQATPEDAACASHAIVPNVLKSRDKFNNQGTTEFELYTLVTAADGAWRIDAQETLFDQSDVDRWFPGEKIPEFRDQY
ncbi:MAG: hypothetical protein H6977_13465 [Gammaproteobacteria bacterium]|nr:hypothetical protein [Gammaproteobacteria bacterium]MCP5201018.1 hypothetical protein [Gammaproteobacteria bacterium]